MAEVGAEMWIVDLTSLDCSVCVSVAVDSQCAWRHQVTWQ